VRGDEDERSRERPAVALVVVMGREGDGVAFEDVSVDELDGGDDSCVFMIGFLFGGLRSLGTYEGAFVYLYSHQ
jgi:hypothetical protein